MNIEGVINYIIKSAKQFPGSHQTPQPRTSASCSPIEAFNQMMLIWKATTAYLKDNIEQGWGINIKNFGAFTFEVQSELPKPAHGMESAFKPA